MVCSTAQALPIYGSSVTKERTPFCKRVEAAAEDVASGVLTAKGLKDILSSPGVQKLTPEDQLLVADVLVLADKRKSWFWAYEYCMDRLST